MHHSAGRPWSTPPTPQRGYNPTERHEQQSDYAQDSLIAAGSSKNTPSSQPAAERARAYAQAALNVPEVSPMYGSPQTLPGPYYNLPQPRVRAPVFTAQTEAALGVSQDSKRYGSPQAPSAPYDNFRSLHTWAPATSQEEPSFMAPQNSYLDLPNHTSMLLPGRAPAPAQEPSPLFSGYPEMSYPMPPGGSEDNMMFTNSLPVAPAQGLFRGQYSGPGQVPYFDFQGSPQGRAMGSNSPLGDTTKNNITDDCTEKKPTRKAPTRRAPPRKAAPKPKQASNGGASSNQQSDTQPAQLGAGSSEPEPAPKKRRLIPKSEHADSIIKVRKRKNDPAPVRPQVPSSGFFFDGRSHATTWEQNNILFETPKGDTTIPRTDQDLKRYVKEAMDAFVDVSNICEKPSNHMVKAKFKTEGGLDLQKVEATMWRLVGEVQDLYLAGAWTKPAYDEQTQLNIAFTKDLTFDERWVKIRGYLKWSKTMCHGLYKGGDMMIVIGAPGMKLRSSESNHRSNADRPLKNPRK